MALVSMNTYLNYMQAYQNSGVRQLSQLQDFKAAQKETQALIDQYSKAKGETQALAKDSSQFLNDYTAGMRRMDTAAAKLTNGGVNRLLQNSDGEVTAEGVKNTIGAVRDMVGEYNSSLKLLNDNAARGPGVERQLERMVRDPAPARSMEMVGLSVNKDGTLALDEEKLTAALTEKDDTLRKTYTDVLGGAYGVAESVRQDARAGLNTRSNTLVSNDVGKLQARREDDPIRSFFQNMRGGSNALYNSAAAGVMMNLLA